MKRGKKYNKAVKRSFVSIFIFLVIFVFGKQNLFCEETGIDLYCFENAPYAVIGKISDIKNSVDAQGYGHWKAKVAEIENIEVLKGGPLPKNISVLFELDSKYTNDERLVKGRKVLLFLNPSLAYYYIPILYGSVYFLEDADIGLWTKKIKSITSILRDAIPEETLKEHGFYNLNDCKIFYKTTGAWTDYGGELTLLGNGTAKVEIRQIDKKEPILIELKVPEEYIKDLISLFARMDFFNIKYVENKMVKDAPLETITYSYGKKSNTMEGYAEAYATDLTDHYFSEVSQKLGKLWEYVKENKYVSAEKIHDFKETSSLNRSFEFVKEKIDSGELKQSYQDIIGCKEKAKLISYLISKIDFKDNTSWFQGKARVNVVRLLRYLTHKDSGCDDKFLYNSTDEEIQKVKATWKSLWENK